MAFQGLSGGMRDPVPPMHWEPGVLGTAPPGEYPATHTLLAELLGPRRPFVNVLRNKVLNKSSPSKHISMLWHLTLKKKSKWN